MKKSIGGDIVTLKITNPDIESIRKLNFIKEIETRDDLVLLTVTNANENLPLILQTIGKVESVEVHSPTLNDVFLNFTGRTIREDSPEGSWAERSMNYRAKK
jgi:ABC-2 type transport system ATP-binding protein